MRKKQYAVTLTAPERAHLLALGLGRHTDLTAQVQGAEAADRLGVEFLPLYRAQPSQDLVPVLGHEWFPASQGPCPGTA